MSSTLADEAIALVRCPFCHTALDPRDNGLSCESCGRTYPISDGIASMLHPDLPGAREKLAEVAGWPEKAKSEGWYEPDDAVDTVLPFPAREIPGWEDISWLATGHSFQVLLDR